ncbi:1-acylglycerol-3-phosphate O-acyltransferase [Aureococcus anophagefferens]|uniref:1-acylglycerol-3-phosphate O-acyltransferase n=1 Tax=Aureococcus anophagefferens TaxID=44056 RepID=A0ABR1GEQ2_AURAN
MFAPSKTMWRDHGNKFPQRPSSAQPRLSRPRPPVVVVKGLPQGGPGPALDTERLVYSPRSDRSASPRGRPASAARARPASARTSRERRAPKPKAVDWRVARRRRAVAAPRRLRAQARDGYDGPPPRERPRPAAVARREAERAACAAPAAPEDEPGRSRAATASGRRLRAGLAVSMMRGEDIVGAYAARPRCRRRWLGAGARARKETWEPERLERTILARVEERAARSLSGYRYLRCAMFLRSFFGDGVDAVSAGQFGALLRAKLGIHVEDADVVRLWVQRFGAKSGEHRLASRHLIVKLTPKDRAGGPAWDANAFADRGAAVSPRERERDVASGETAEQIERLIRDRLDQKMRKLSNFRYQNAYAVFQDDSSSGKAARKAVTREALKERLAAKLDVRLSASQLDALFARYDVEGRGALDVRDLVRRLVPSDFPGASPRREAEKPAKGTKMGALHVPRAARPRPLADPSWTVDDVEALLRSKIAGSRRPLAHYEHQNVYRVFSRAPPDASAPPAKGHANNLTCGRFAAVLEHAFGLALTPPQATRLFLRYDPSGLGRLGVIIPNMLPKDWTPNCGVLPKKPGAAAAPQTSPGRNPLHLVEFPPDLAAAAPPPSAKKKQAAPAPGGAAPDARARRAAARRAREPEAKKKQKTEPARARPASPSTPRTSPPSPPPRSRRRSGRARAGRAAPRAPPAAAPAAAPRPPTAGAPRPPDKGVGAVRYRAHVCNDKVRDLLKVRGLNVGPKHAASWDAAPAVRAR